MKRHTGTIESKTLVWKSKFQTIFNLLALGVNFTKINPKNFYEYDTEEIEKALEKISGVDMVTDLHLWSLSSGKFALNVHLRLLEGAQNAQQEVLQMADKLLRKKFNINHLTI